MTGNARPQAPETPLIDIKPLSLNKAFKKVLRACGLEHTGDGLPRSLYDLRHYYITKALLAGKVAVNTMTSLQMIERHYNHVHRRQNHGVDGLRPRSLGHAVGGVMSCSRGSGSSLGCRLPRHVIVVRSLGDLASGIRRRRWSEKMGP